MSRKPLLAKGVCNYGHEIKSEEDLYITPYNSTRDGSRVDTRCKACHLDRARLISRKKRGITPLDAPIRHYPKKRAPNKPKATKELIRLVSSDPELAEKLLQYVPQARRSISSRRILTKPIHDNC